jgi:LysR family transcriptional regulator of gallate degradation
VIGTLPYSRTVLTPRTIHQVLTDHPQLRISTREGPYSMLETALRSGDLDLIIGATRELEHGSTLATEVLFEDELSVIARHDHPLATAAKVSLAQLLTYGWLLPLQQTPARALFDRFLASQGALPPTQIVETSSLSTIRGLLLASDRLALLSRHQVHYEEAAGLLVALPIALAGTRRPIGITVRANTTPSSAARVFCDELRRMAAALAPG